MFEADITIYLLKLAKPGTFLFDIGANIGVMSVPILASNHQVSVVSIECSPSTLPYLRRTHANSAYQNRWRLFEVAISDKDGVVDFFTSGPESGAHDGLKDTRRVPGSTKVEVHARTLDGVWTEIGRPSVSVIKIDIEGGESAALRGAKMLIETCKPYILFEWNLENINAYGQEEIDIFNLIGKGYKLYSLPILIEVTKAILPLELARGEMFLLAPD